MLDEGGLLVSVCTCVRVWKEGEGERRPKSINSGRSIYKSIC